VDTIRSEYQNGNYHDHGGDQRSFFQAGRPRKVCTIAAVIRQTNRYGP
jgi:hypothetical protein